MKETVGNYEVVLEEDLAIVNPLKPRCRAKYQLAQTEEFVTLKPNYVRDYVIRKSRYSGTIYLIHFDTPYKHARHYLGYTQNLEQRLKDHLTGHGSRLMQVVSESGISWRLARTWYGDRYLERRLKGKVRQSGSKGLKRYCPICKEESNG